MSGFFLSLPDENNIADSIEFCTFESDRAAL